MRSMYYDYDGNEIDLHLWEALFSSRSIEGASVRWKVADTQTDDFSVSTVWDGINQNFLGDGPPLIFETLARGLGLDGDRTERYESAEEAWEGHQRWVERMGELAGLERAARA